MRDNKRGYPEWYVGLVGFCASYKSKFFGGYANEALSDDGRRRGDEAIRALKRQRESLQGIPFICCDYRNWRNVKNAVIYCDPPYKGTTGYSNRNFDTAAFFDWCQIVGQNNVVIVSEYEAPEDFRKIESFGTLATLGTGQAEKRREAIFTTGIGCEILKGVTT